MKKFIRVTRQWIYYIMTKLLLFCFIALTLHTLPVEAQKQLKSLRAYVKAKNTGEAMKEVVRLEADSVCRMIPELYELAVRTQELINDVENEKVYLKQQCDTNKFFNSTLQIFNYAVKGDSVERSLNAGKKAKFKLRKKHAEMLRKYYPNLNMGARYFYTRGKFEEAKNLLEMSLLMARQPMWADQPVDSTHKEFVSNMYRYTYSAYISQDYTKVERYKHILLNMPEYEESVVEICARSAEKLGKTSDYEKYLRLGIGKFPHEEYFFEELAKIYMKAERYKDAVKLADWYYQTDTTSNKALRLKVQALYSMQSIEECVEVAKHLAKRDTLSQYPEVNYYVGQLMMSQIDSLVVPTNMFSEEFKETTKRRKAICSAARPYLERYRSLNPQDSEKWAPFLYKIYLELNLGKEFEDICKILQ